MADLERTLESLSVSADERNALLAELVDRQDRAVKLAEDQKSQAAAGGGVVGGGGAGAAGGGAKKGPVGGARGFALDAAVAGTNPFQSAFSATVEKGKAFVSGFVGDRATEALANASGVNEKIFEVQSAEAQTRALVQRLTAVTGKPPSQEQIRGIFGQARGRAERAAAAQRATTSALNKEIPSELLKEVSQKLSGLLTESQRQTQAVEQQNQRMGGS